MKAIFLACCLIVCTSSMVDGGVREAAEYSRTHGERSLIIWQKGRVLQERYASAAIRDRGMHVYSITKSLCALAILGSRRLHPDDLASEVMSEWRGDPRKGRITIRTLLNQTSGLASGYGSLYSASNKRLVVARISAQSSPGERFEYGPSHYEALEAIVSRRHRGSSLLELERGLLGPLGISPISWRKDRSGSPYFSAGAQLTPADLLRIGQLVRRGGWYWIFPVVSSSRMRQALEGSGANPMYGMGFWLNRGASRRGSVERDAEETLAAGLSRYQWEQSCLSRTAPHDLVALAGSNGQRVYVSRSRELVIVRLGQGRNFRDPDFLGAFFR